MSEEETYEEFQASFEKILKERMFINFCYSTNEFKYLLCKLSDPEIVDLKRARKMLFMARRHGVIECIRRNNIYYWYIGLPLLKEAEACPKCYQHVWGNYHEDVCEY